MLHSFSYIWPNSGGIKTSKRIFPRSNVKFFIAKNINLEITENIYKFNHKISVHQRGFFCKKSVSVSASCKHYNTEYDHGEVFSPRKCISCHCNDGHVDCKRQKECPQLSCPKEEQILEEGKCCPICKGEIHFK